MLVGISGYISSGKDTVAQMIQFIVAQYEIHGQIYDKFDPTEKNYRYSDKWEIKKFAAKLKQMCSLLTGIPVEDFEKQSVKDSFLGPEWNIVQTIPADHHWSEMKRNRDWSPPLCINCRTNICQPYYYVCEFCLTSRRAYWAKKHPTNGGPMTVRTLLQKLGTDAVRDKVHQNAWVNALFADYKARIEGRETPRLSGGMGGGNVIGVPVWPNWIISDLRFPNEFQAIKDRGGICIRLNRGLRPDGIPHLTAPHVSETALDSAAFDYTIYNDGTIEQLLERVRTMLLHFKIIS